MSNTQVRLQLAEAGGAFARVTVPVPVPGPDQVVIRNKAVALNPIDWKRRKTGFRISSWPTALGSELSGVVEAVGKDINNFKPGDEVFSMRGNDIAGAAFQELVTVSSWDLGKKPASLSFEEAAALPIAYLTASAALFIGLSVPLESMTPAEPKSPKSILVLGGSSAVGTAAIQLLRQRLPSATIIATSSPAHHAHLKSLGANECFARSAQDDPEEIISAAPGGNGVDAIIDTVGAALQQPTVFKALNPNGLKLYTEIAAVFGIKVPEGIDHKLIISSELTSLPGGKEVMNVLSSSLHKGEYKLPISVDVVGKGFDAVDIGLKKLEDGVSGTKLAISF